VFWQRSAAIWQQSVAVRQRDLAVWQPIAAKTLQAAKVGGGPRRKSVPLDAGMDLLTALIGSGARADLLAALFGSPPRRLGLRDLGRAAKRSHQALEPHIRRFVEAGLIRASAFNGRTTYEPDLAAPAAREIAALVRQTRGRIPLIRRALIALRTPTLAWALPSSRPEGTRHLDIVVLTGAPRSLVRVQLAHLVARDCQIHCMSIREWVARLDKGDVDLRRLRRARKLWIRGSWEELLAAERAVIESKRLLQRVTANWHEELSDDWDDQWDPFQPFVMASR
jgi:hypothetical protein